MKNLVTFEMPVRPRSRWFPAVAFLLVAIATMGALFLASHPHSTVATVALIASAAGLMFGVNTVAYEYPATSPSSTPPTAAVMRTHQSMSAIVTGDGAATTVVVTHNWALSAADLTNGFPWVRFEPLLAAYYTANPLVTTKATNSVTLTTVAFSGAAIRVSLERPYSALR